MMDGTADEQKENQQMQGDGRQPAGTGGQQQEAAQKASQASPNRRSAVQTAAQLTRRRTIVRNAANVGRQKQDWVANVAEQALIKKKIEELEVKSTEQEAPLLGEQTPRQHVDDESIQAASDGGMPRSPSGHSQPLNPGSPSQKSATAPVRFKRSYHELEEALKQRWPDLYRDEMLLKGIGDWDDFNQKIQEDNYEFPSQFIKDRIDVNSWRNIPIPLQEATEQFEKCFINLSNIVSEVICEQQSRTAFVATRLRELSKTADDKAAKLKRQLEAQRRALNDLIEEFKMKSEGALKQQKLKLDFLHKEIENDRQYIQTRLMHMDDTNVIKKWVEGELQRVEIQLRNEYRMEFRRVDYKLEKAWNENLLIPDLVGENEFCLYRNMQEYCKAQRAEFADFREQFEPTVNRMITDKVLQVKNPLNLKMSDCKKDVHDLKVFVQQSQTEINKAFDTEKQHVESKLADVLPQLEAEVRKMREQHHQFVELPSKLAEATGSLDAVKSNLLDEMKSLDTVTSKRMEEMREQIMQQFNKVHGDLDMKINDVERKSMAFAQRAASNTTGPGEKKGKPDMKDALKSKMKTRIGGMLNKGKGAQGHAGIVSPLQMQSQSLYSHASDKLSPYALSPNAGTPPQEDIAGTTNTDQTANIKTAMKAALNTAMQSGSHQDSNRAEVAALQKQLMESFRLNARQFFLMKRESVILRRKQEAEKAQKQQSSSPTFARETKRETDWQKRQSNLIKESPLPKQVLESFKSSPEQNSNLKAKEETDVTQDKTLLTPKGGVASIRLEMQQSPLASVKEKSENSGAAEMHVPEAQRATITQSSMLSVNNQTIPDDKPSELRKPELRKQKTLQQEKQESREPPLQDSVKNKEQGPKIQNFSSLQARVDQFDNGNVAADHKRSSQDEVEEFKLSLDPEKETLRITVEQFSSTPMAALPRSLDHETREQQKQQNELLDGTNVRIKEREATKESNIKEEQPDPASAPDSAVGPDPAVLPLLDQSNESNADNPSDKKEKSKVKFKEDDDNMNEEFMLNAFAFDGIEKIVEQKIEESFIKYFGPSDGGDDKIRKLITQFIKNQMERHLTSELDAKVERQFMTHVHNHQIDPTLLALIHNFVPGMKNIELKKDIVFRDKKGLVDRNKKRNHSKFQKVYTAEGLNFHSGAQSMPNYKIISETDLNQRNSEQSMTKQHFKENDIFDVLTSDDRELIDKSFVRVVMDKNRRQSPTHNERYGPNQQARDGTLLAHQYQSIPGKAQTFSDAETKTFGDQSGNKKLRDGSLMAGGAGTQEAAQGQVEFTDLAQPFNIEMKTNKIDQRRTTVTTAPHPKSAAAARKPSEFYERPITNNTLQQNFISRTRFKAHEGAGLVDPNSLNDMPTAALSTNYAAPDIGSARVLNPVNHQLLHNFGFAEETMSKDAFGDGGHNNSGIFTLKNQRRVFSQERGWPNSSVKNGQGVSGTPPLAEIDGNTISANYRDESRNCGKSTGNLTGVGALRRNPNLALAQTRVPSSPRQMTGQFMTQRAYQQRNPNKLANSRPGSIRESNPHDESHGEFENDMGLSCRQMGIKTQIPGIAGGILALQETRAAGTQASDHDAMSGSANVNASFRTKRGHNKHKKGSQTLGALNSSTVLREKAKGKSQY